MVTLNFACPFFSSNILIGSPTLQTPLPTKANDPTGNNNRVTPGCVTPLDGYDDDQDGVPDWQETYHSFDNLYLIPGLPNKTPGIVLPTKNGLTEIDLNTTGTNGTLTLKSDDKLIRIWEANSNNRLTLSDKSWPISGPTTIKIYVEGLAVGQDSLTLTYTGISDGTVVDIASILVPDQILRDNNAITSVNNSVCAGQQINLTFGLSNLVTASAISSNQWAIIPGVSFKNYQPTATNSNYAPLVNSDYATNFINFYWSDSALSRVVTCQQTIYGQTVTSADTFVVVKPVANINSTVGTVSVDTNFNGVSPNIPYLHFGRPHDTDDNYVPGMMFTHTVPSFATSGTYKWVQLVNKDTVTEVDTLPGKVLPPSTQIITPGVDAGNPPDTVFPYATDAKPILAQDSPGSPLFANTQTYSRQFDATMYLMWQPNSSAVGGDNTVMVPISSLEWAWSGTAVNSKPNQNADETGWTLQTSSAPSPNEPDTLTNIEPQWTVNADTTTHAQPSQ